MGKLILAGKRPGSTDTTSQAAELALAAHYKKLVHCFCLKNRYFSVYKIWRNTF